MFFKLKYFRQTKNIKLADSEKLSVHNHLKAFMKEHPVRVPSQERQLGQEARPNFLSSFKSMMLKPIPITLSALLLLGGGTAFAAERALPNEALYPIKIQVNERVRATLSPTTEGKAKWDARVAERRLEEAEQLAIEQKLDVKTQAQIETNFDEQAKLVQEKITRLKAEGNIEAAVELSNTFQASLRAHETIFNQIETKTTENTNVNDSLLEKIKLNAAALGTVNIDSQTNTNVDAQAALKASAYEKQQSASVMIAEAKQTFSNTTLLNAEIKLKATTLLTLATDEFQQGTESYNQLDFKLALSHYERAQAHAQELHTLLKASQTLKLDPTFIAPTVETKPVPTPDTFNSDLKLDSKANIIIQPTETKLDLGL